jgi:hypothetical protein
MLAAKIQAIKTHVFKRKVYDKKENENEQRK